MNPLLQMTGSGDSAWPLQAPEELARALATAGDTLKLKSGSRLFSFGDAAGGVFLIVKGAARASIAAETGRELVCRMAEPGAVLGLPSALCATSYQFDVEALEGLEAVFLPTESVNEILRQRPELCMQAMQMMCDELNALKQTRDHLQNCGKHSCSLHGACTKTVEQ